MKLMSFWSKLLIALAITIFATSGVVVGVLAGQKEEFDMGGTIKYSVPSFTVEFLDYDNNVFDTQTVFYGQNATAPSTNPTKTGYTFTGWEDFTNITKDRQVKSKWTPTIFKVTLDNQGATSAGTTALWYKYNTVENGYYYYTNEACTAGLANYTITKPTKTGYTFDGYFTQTNGAGTQYVNASGTCINNMYKNEARNFTLYAKWTANQYTVTFNANGGSVSPTSKTVTHNSTYGTLPTATAPTVTGYTGSFKGWFTSATGGTQVTESTKVTITANQTLYAQYTQTANTYTVTFNANGGSVSPTSKTVTYNSTYGTLPTATAPSVAGYTGSFKGWFTAATGGTQVTESTKVTITANQTLYAQYTQTANTYTVTFNANGGSVSPTSKTVTYNSTYGTLPTPTRTNYSFNGWFTAASGGSKIEPTTTISTASNHTLYAQWTGASYTVTFDANGGTLLSKTNLVLTSSTGNWNYNSISSGKFDPSTTYILTIGTATLTSGTATNFNVRIYDFTDNKDVADIKQGIFGQSNSITLTTKSTLDPSHDNRLILYAGLAGATANNGATFSNMSLLIKKLVTYGSTYGNLPTATKTVDGYTVTFKGWFTAASGGTQITESTTVTITADQILYAQYTQTANKYTVKFDANGGTCSTTSKEVSYASTYGTLPTATAPTVTGYTGSFKGWFTAASGGTQITESTTVTIADDQTLYAQYTQTANKYTVKFDANGGTCSTTSKEVTFGSTYGDLPTATKTVAGYTVSFKGWFTAATGGTQVTASTTVSTASSHTLYAQYTQTANKYTVKFDANGGTCSTNSKQVTYASTYGTLPTATAPTVTGYTGSFKGWFTAASGGTQITESTTVTITADQTLYAQYTQTANTYTVTFNANGGSCSPTSKTVTYGSTYGELPTATKTVTGYTVTFNGWFTAATGGTQVTTSSKVEITANQTLYAQYTQTANKYTVKFDANGGTCSTTSKQVTFGSTYGDLPTATKTVAGYTVSFKGWFTAATGGTQVTSSTAVTITANQTLYAQYTQTANTYTVTFDANGGSVSPTSKTVTFGSTYGDLPTATKEGYFFDGWFTEASGGNKIEESTIVSTATEQTLYAQWAIKTFIVTFDANGGTCGTDTKEVTYGSTYGTLPTATAPTVTGHTGSFKGWFTSATGGTQVTESTKVTITADQTLYAQYTQTANTFAVTFNANEGSCAATSKEVIYGSTYGDLPTAIKIVTGHTVIFNGWFTAASGGTKVTSSTIVTLASNQTLYAQYTQTINTYTVTFDANGGTCETNTKKVTYESTYGDLPTATHSNYTFAGWFTASIYGTQVTASTTVSITADQTLYAHWVPNEYIVTFLNYNGSIFATQVVKYGQDATPPTQNPTRDNYTFTGWKDYTNITSDRSVPSTWTGNKYTISFDANGGSCDTSSKTVTYGSSYGKLPAATRTYNNNFLGWSTEANNKKLVDSNSIVSIASNHTLYALWQDSAAYLRKNWLAALTAANSNYKNINTIQFAQTAPTGSGYTIVSVGATSADGETAYNLSYGSGGVGYISAYIKANSNDSSKYDIIFYSSHTIYAPTDSSNLFEDLSNLSSIKFDNFDTSNVIYMSGMFRNCRGLTSLDVTNFDTSNVTNMSEMFYECRGLTSLDVTNFDTSNVTNMSEMFYECRGLTSLDVSNFDTNNVTDMSYMFYNYGELTSLDVSNFDTSKVTDMRYMFNGCRKLTSLDVTNFDTSNVTDMSYMFYYCRTLTSLDVTNFDTSSVTNMRYMFNGCSGLTSLNVSNFDTSMVTDMRSMFSDCSSLTSLDVSNFDTSKVVYMGEADVNSFGMFSNCSRLTSLDLSSFNTSNVTNMSGMFYNCSGLTSLNVSNFDTSNVTRMVSMFSGCNKLTSLDLSNFDTSNVIYMSGMFRNCPGLTSLDVTNFDTSNVTNMSEMFYECRELTSLDVTNFDTSKVTYMNNMFYGCSGLTSLDVTNFDTSKVTYMNNMFYGCSGLTSLDLSNFNMSKCTSSSSTTGMLNNCSVLAEIKAPKTIEYAIKLPTKTDYSWKIKDSSDDITYSYISTLNINKTFLLMPTGTSSTKTQASFLRRDWQSIVLKAFDTGPGLISSITFTNEKPSLKESVSVGASSCDGLIGWSSDCDYYDVTAYFKEGSSYWDAIIFYSPVQIYAPTDSSYLFSNEDERYYLTDLDSITFDNFDTSMVNDMSYMFCGCGRNTYGIFDINFDISNVIDMSYMFANIYDGRIKFSCIDTKNLGKNASFMFCSGSTKNHSLHRIDLSEFDTSNVTDMSYMFYNCGELTNIDLSEFDTSNVTDMSYMFYNCGELTNIDLSNLNTSNVTNMSYMFRDCTGLTSLDLSSLNTSNVTNMSCMFEYCSSLTNLDVSNFDTSNVTSMSYMFSDCTGLTSLDVTNFDTSNVTNMSEMFYECRELTSLDLSSFDISKCTETYSTNSMLAGCTGLTEIKTPEAIASRKMITLPTKSEYSWYGADKTAYTAISTSNVRKTLTLSLSTYRLSVDDSSYVTVYRTSSPIGNGSIGALSSGATIYYGDVLEYVTNIGYITINGNSYSKYVDVSISYSLESGSTTSDSYKNQATGITVKSEHTVFGNITVSATRNEQYRSVWTGSVNTGTFRNGSKTIGNSSFNTQAYDMISSGYSYQVTGKMTYGSKSGQSESSSFDSVDSWSGKLTYLAISSELEVVLSTNGVEFSSDGRLYYATGYVTEIEIYY